MNSEHVFFEASGTNVALGSIYPTVKPRKGTPDRRFLMRTIHASHYEHPFEICCMLMRFTDETCEAVVIFGGEGHAYPIRADDWNFVHYQCQSRNLRNDNPAMFSLLVDIFIESGWFPEAAFRLLLTSEQRPDVPRVIRRAP